MTEKIGKYDINSIVLGNSLELMSDVPNESIDLIITDPPWHDEFLYLYEGLAIHAARVLKPGKFALAYCGNDNIPIIIKYFADSGLDWFRMMAGVQMNSDDKYFKKKIFVKWRPVLAFTKGSPDRKRWMPDAGYTTRDKKYHIWGQGIELTRRWIHALTDPGDLVLDPFCGGGTTAAAAKEYGRNYLTFEIDPEAAESSSKRLNSIGQPLMTIIYEQSPLGV